jgi:hypothetical protein
MQKRGSTKLIIIISAAVIILIIGGFLIYKSVSNNDLKEINQKMYNSLKCLSECPTEPSGESIVFQPGCQASCAELQKGVPPEMLTVSNVEDKTVDSSQEVMNCFLNDLRSGTSKVDWSKWQICIKNTLPGVKEKFNLN